MNKKIIGLLVASVLIIPAVSSAQSIIGDVAPDSSLQTCTDLVNNLQYRSTDFRTNGEVSILQDFLSPHYLNSEPTGFFGKMTLAAVKQFQRDNNLLNSGYVGPLTRAKIKELSCGTQAVSPPMPSNNPGGNNAGTISISPGDEPMVVNATFTLGSSCSSYTLSWGDGTSANSSSSQGTSCAQVLSTYSVSHRYANAGTYSVTFQTGSYPAQAKSVTVRSATSTATTITNGLGGQTYSIGDTVVWTATVANAPIGSKVCVVLIRQSDQHMFAFPPNNPGCVTVPNPSTQISFTGTLISNSGYDLTQGTYRLQTRLIAGAGSSTGADAATIALFTSGIFNIVSQTTPAPTITVLSPNGGERLIKGSGTTYAITWNSQNVANGYVYIKLRKGSDTYNGPEGGVSEAIAANQGSYIWTVPNTLPDGNDYSIRVISMGSGNVFDDSNAPFTITSQTASTPAPSVTVTSVVPASQGLQVVNLQFANIPVGWNMRIIGVSGTGQSPPLPLPVTSTSLLPVPGSYTSNTVADYTLPTGGQNFTAITIPLSALAGSYVVEVSDPSAGWITKLRTPPFYIGQLVTTPAPAPTATLSQSTPTTVSGTPYTVSWGSTNATSCSVTYTGPDGGGIISSGPTSGSHTFTTPIVGTYVGTNTCTGVSGTSPASASVTHTVTAPAAASCTWGGGNIGPWGAGCNASYPASTFSNGQSTGAISSTASGYTGSVSLTCNNGSFTLASQSCSAVTPSSPSITLTAAASSITSGQSTTLHWVITPQTASCSLSSTGTYNGTIYPNISSILYDWNWDTGALTAANNTYTLSCTNQGSAATTRSVTVAVTPRTVAAPAPTATLSQSTPTTVSGTPYTVSWGSTNATSCSVTYTGPDGGGIISSGPTSGSHTFTTPIVGTYVGTNTCTGVSGTSPASASVTHTVTAPAAASCTWGGGNIGPWGAGCNASYPASTFSNGQSTGAISSTASGYTGSVSLTCNNGSFTLASQSCSATVGGSVGSAPLQGGTSQTASVFNALFGSQTSGTASATFGYHWNQNLGYGSTAFADVSALQIALMKEGVFSDDITGGFYSQTFEAVKQFQAKYGIESTGFVGEKTRAKLNELYGK